jgi:hypothetical protein
MCRHPDKLVEALWDAVKLVPFTRDEHELAGAYLIYGAPAAVWAEPGRRPAELFADADHNIFELLSRHEKDWRWLLTGGQRRAPGGAALGVHDDCGRRRPDPQRDRAGVRTAMLAAAGE